MTDGPSKDNLLLKTVVGILSSALLVAIGYGINSYLSRDELTIEYVRFVPSTQAQGPLLQIQGKLRRLGSNVFGQFTSIYPPCPLLGDPRNPGDEEMRILQTCLESFVDDKRLDIESMREVQSELDKNPAPSDLDVIISKSALLFTPSLSDPGIKLAHEQKLQTAKHEIKTATTDSTDDERKARDLLELLKQIKITRTGSLVILTTIRNSGDTDGLVMDVPENYVILNKNSAKLPIRLGGQYNPATMGSPHPSRNVYAWNVPKRSAVTIAFLLDPSVLPDPPRVAIIALLKQSQYTDLKGKVILKDTRNRDIESKEFDFPAGPDQ